MQLDNSHGARAYSPEEAEELEKSGFERCYKSDCNFFLSPEAQGEVQNHPDAGYYTCPKCKTTWDQQSELPWHGNPEMEDMSAGQLQSFHSGGGTRIGLSMAEQAQIGEDLIAEHGLPGYGAIMWWHPGGATGQSPLDGTTKDWGIEVKTLSFDAEHHRFVPGNATEKAAKNNAAAEMGLKGVLGVLVLLNFRTSIASIYVKQMPLEPWKNSQGRTYSGVTTFRTNSAEKLIEELPFKNPFMQPHNSVPHPPTPVPGDDISF